MRPLLERCHLAVAHLVEDPARVLVAEVVDARPLPLAEGEQRRGRQLGRERERLQAREDAVPAEHGHEPREAGRGQALPRRDRRREAQSREVDQAPLVGRLQRVRVALDPRRGLQPAREVLLHVLPPALAGELRPLVPLAVAEEGGDDVEPGRPLAVRLDRRREREAVLVDLRRSRGRDQRRPAVGVALVAEPQHAAALDPGHVLPLLGERVLDLEEVGEVAAGLDPDGQVDRLVLVVQDRQLLVEPVARPRAGGSPRASRPRRRFPCRARGRSAPRSSGDRRPRAG